MNKQWSGTTHHTLKAHIYRHQSAFVYLSEASDNVSQQLLNDRTRVGYLIDSITSTSVNVVAALASIRKIQYSWPRYFPSQQRREAEIQPQKMG